jgi:hypothetical protein
MTPRHRRVAVGIAFAALMTLVVAVSVAAFAYWHRYPTRVAVPVEAMGDVAATGWSMKGVAVIESDGPGPTSVLVAVTRRTPAGVLPALHAAFDGSGGGEAVPVECGSRGRTRWAVAPGREQWVVLRCDLSVEPWQLRAMQRIRAGTG